MVRTTPSVEGADELPAAGAAPPEGAAAGAQAANAEPTINKPTLVIPYWRNVRRDKDFDLLIFFVPLLKNQ